MTNEELIHVIDEVRRSLQHVEVSQTEIAAELAGLGAKVEAQQARVRDETTVLFGRVREQEKDITAIRLDYLPRGAHEAFKAETIDPLKGDVSAIKTQVARWGAAVAVLLVLVELGLRFIGHG